MARQALDAVMGGGVALWEVHPRTRPMPAAWLGSPGGSLTKELK